jgi:hypothetical protein
MTIPSKSTTPALERRRARARRQEEAVLLRQRGLSTREIADRLGCAPCTVRADLRAANAVDPILVTGRDGKTYPATTAARKKRRAEKEEGEQKVVIDPVVARCAYCDFVARGEVDEARQAFSEHVCNRPPPPAKSARSRPRGRGFRTRK